MDEQGITEVLEPAALPSGPESETAPAEPTIRGALTVFVFTDGTWRVDMNGMSKIEAPTLARLVAKRIEADLGL